MFYHRTQTKNLDSIMSEGLQPSYNKTRELDRFLDEHRPDNAPSRCRSVFMRPMSVYNEVEVGRGYCLLKITFDDVTRECFVGSDDIFWKMGEEYYGDKANPDPSEYWGWGDIVTIKQAMGVNIDRDQSPEVFMESEVPPENITVVQTN